MLNELIYLVNCPLCGRYEPYQLNGWWCPVCGTTDEQRSIEDLKRRLTAIEQILQWDNNIED